MNDWFTFFKHVTQFPWARSSQLLAEKQSGTELDSLLLKYENLKEEAVKNMPHGPGLLNRLDTIRPMLEAQKFNERELPIR